MTSTKFYKGFRTYEGRRTDTVRAFDLDTAKALIRDEVRLGEPAEWEEVERYGRQEEYVLSNYDDDEVKIVTHFIKGEPEDINN